jgi:hypothetical protein
MQSQVRQAYTGRDAWRSDPAATADPEISLPLLTLSFRWSPAGAADRGYESALPRAYFSVMTPRRAVASAHELEYVTQ